MKVALVVGAILFVSAVAHYLVAPSQYSVIILIPTQQQEDHYHSHTLPFAIGREQRVCRLVYDQANTHHHGEYNYHAVLDILSCHLYNNRQVHISYTVFDRRHINSADEMVHAQLSLLQRSLEVNFPLVKLELVPNLQ